MKTNPVKNTGWFVTLCVVALASAVAFAFARERDFGLSPWPAVLAPAGLLIWSAVAMRSNPVRGFTGILVLLTAGLLTLTMTGWLVHDRTVKTLPFMNRTSTDIMTAVRIK